MSHNSCPRRADQLLGECVPRWFKCANDGCGCEWSALPALRVALGMEDCPKCGYRSLAGMPNAKPQCSQNARVAKGLRAEGKARTFHSLARRAVLSEYAELQIGLVSDTMHSCHAQRSRGRMSTSTTS
jgi:hypothetical protein